MKTLDVGAPVHLPGRLGDPRTQQEAVVTTAIIFIVVGVIITNNDEELNIF